MFEQNTIANRGEISLPAHGSANTQVCADRELPDARDRGTGSSVVVRLMVELERALHAELPVAKHVSLLKRLQPAVVRLAGQMPKPVVQTRQNATGKDAAQTMEQHLNLLMVENLKLALMGIGHSELAYSVVSAHLRLWLVRNLFRYLRRLIEYAVRWDRPYPFHIWEMLHELYFDLGPRADMAIELDVHRERRVGFDPKTEYKRLLLIGLVGQLVPVSGRSARLFGTLASLARESRLVPAPSCEGAFDLYLVGIGRDEPPRLSGVIEQDFNSWVFEPAQEFLDLVASLGHGSRAG